MLTMSAMSPKSTHLLQKALTGSGMSDKLLKAVGGASVTGIGGTAGASNGKGKGNTNSKVGSGIGGRRPSVISLRRQAENTNEAMLPNKSLLQRFINMKRNSARSSRDGSKSGSKSGSKEVSVGKEKDKESGNIPKSGGAEAAEARGMPNAVESSSNAAESAPGAMEMNDESTGHWFDHILEMPSVGEQIDHDMIDHDVEEVEQRSVRLTEGGVVELPVG